jgi:hypothetical protein
MTSSQRTSPWRISRRGLVAAAPVVAAALALTGAPAPARPRVIECLADLRGA